MIRVLDQRKEEAIERTFKQVAQNFSEIFEKLVPAGRGALVMQRRIQQDSSAESTEDNGSEAVENYIGVGITASKS